jgi:uncharacterized Zn-finger protein
MYSEMLYSFAIHQRILHTCRVVIHEQIFICSVCKQGFCSKNDLKTHERKHDIAVVNKSFSRPCFTRSCDLKESVNLLPSLTDI